MLRITRIQERSRRALFFILRFLALAAPLYIILAVGFDFSHFQETVALQTSAILTLFGAPNSVDGYLIRLDGFIFEIVEACTAWKDMLAFLALVTAVPDQSWRKRAKAIAFLPLIHAANLLRLSTTIALGVKDPQVLGLVHNVLWKQGMLMVIFMLWAHWLKKIE